MQICHLLLTRFNIQYQTGDTQGIQPEWIENRLRLFEQYCIPSVTHQTCKDFIWVVLGDVRTPEVYKNKIEAYALAIPYMRVLWWPFDAEDEDFHVPYQQLGAAYAQTADLLITSRLDNDDRIADCYIERVQELAREGVRGIISFPIGTQTFVQSGKLYKIRYVQNHFTSRIEESGFETIMAYNHALVDTSLIHIIENQEPMWDEIVHGSNVLNDYMPKYHYYVSNWSDVMDLSRRWLRFQTHRLVRFGKTRLIPAHKR